MLGHSGTWLRLLDAVAPRKFSRLNEAISLEQFQVGREQTRKYCKSE